MMIDELTWKMLEEWYEQEPKVKCKGANDEQIIEAEKELGVTFSDFYRYFLKYHEVSAINPNNGLGSL